MFLRQSFLSKLLVSSLFIILLNNKLVFAQWVQVALPNVKINCLTPNTNNTILFAGTNNSGIYSTSNNGDSWQRKDNGIITSSVNAINTQTNNFLAGTSNGLFDSQDAGNTWKASTITGLTDPYINAIIFDAFENAYIGTNSGIFFAQKNTPNLTPRNSGLINLTVNSLAISLANMTESLWCGTAAGLFVTTNQATSWTSKNVSNNRINSISTNTMLFFASDAGIYSMTFSQNNPVLTTGGLADVNLLSVCITNIKNNGPTLSADLFAGTGTSGKVMYSKEWGNNWKQVSAGLLSNNRVNCLVVVGPYLIAGTDNGIWRRTLDQLTAVEEQNNSIPTQYYLEQNYPNPFNPSTAIRYALHKEGVVKIEVYSILGQKVESLLDSFQNAGYHEIIFNGQSLSSGVYFYQLSAGEFISTRKFILLK